MKINKLRFLSYPVILIFGMHCLAQESGQFPAQKQELKGQVTYLSSENTYVRFASTALIREGDTLFQMGANSLMRPCLQVVNKSSSSCVCLTLNSCQPMVGDILYAVVVVEPAPTEKPKRTETKVNKADTISPRTQANANDTAGKSEGGAEVKYKQRIFGHISLASYGVMDPSNENDGYVRMVGRLAINAENILNSTFSFKGYGNYQYFLRTGNDTDGIDKYLTLYQASLIYSPNAGFSCGLGRLIIPGVSSIGAFDGFNIEKQLKGFRFGAFLGFRPDYSDYSFNSRLFQYGAYTSYQIQKEKTRLQTTLGFIEQQNGGQIDRRFLYFQESLNIRSKLNLFGSFEMNLYEKFDSSAARNTLSLSSLYLSANYRLNRSLSLFASYDTRKQIIYYETFTSEIERLLADQEARQGVRLRANYKISRTASLGLGYSIRYQSGAGLQSQNLHFYATQRNLPGIGGDLSYRFNRNLSAYLRSDIHSAQYSRDILKDKISMGAYYRYLKYLYTRIEYEVKPQHFAGIEFMSHFKNAFDLSLLGEISIMEKQQIYRLNIRLAKRFNYRQK